MPALSPALPKKNRQPSQHLANGGVVDYIKTKLGFKPQSQQPTSATPAPAAAPPVSTPPSAPEQNLALLGNGTARRAGGFLANRQRQIDEASGYANGGVIRGKGTGTSDDIQRNMPVGTYIMPADSTQAIGASVLQNLGKNAPVNVSNGEYEMPPEQVHAVGVQALNNLKQSTHTPVRNAKGFAPSTAFFANGGVVDDEKPKPNFSVGGGLDPFAKIDNSQVPKGMAAPEPVAPPAPVEKPAAPVVVPPVDAAPPSKGFLEKANDMSKAVLRNNPITAPLAEGSDTRGVVSDGWNQAGMQFDKGNYVRGIGAGVRGLAGAIPAIAVDQARPIVHFATEAGKGLFGIGDEPVANNPNSIEQPKTNSNSPAVNKPSTARPPANVATKPVDTSSVAAPTNSANTTPATKPPAVGNVIREGDEYDANGNLTKVGNKYSGNNIGENFTINGEAPRRGGYMVVPGGGFGGTRAPVSDTGFVPGSARSGGGRVTFVGDTATEERNARLSNGLSPYAGSPNGQLTANQVRVLAGLKENAENNATSRANSELANDGANYRAEMQEYGANARSVIPQQVALEQLGINKESAGLANRAAARQEKLYEKYDAANTPEERAAIAQSIRDLSGKADNPKDYLVDVGGGQSFDEKAGMVLNNPKRWVDSRTGQELGAGRQSAGANADALLWLKENPNDPRAARIRKSLGL